MFKRYLIIGNPISGKGRLSKTIALIKSAFDETNNEYELRFTEYKGHAFEIATQGVNSGFTHIISAGGDGTSSDIVNAICGKDIVFGIIPVGSGNDFPRSAGIPSDVQEAIHTVIADNRVDMDIAKLGDRLFINGLGIGLDGGVAHKFRYFRKLGPFLGYLTGAIIESFCFEGFEVEAKGDRFNYSGKTLLCGASNGATQGGIGLAPTAVMNDGLLDFHFIKDMNPVKRLITLSKALRGEHTNMEEVTLIKIEKLLLETKTDLPAHIDGETFILKKGSHQIDILRNAIKVIVP